MPLGSYYSLFFIKKVCIYVLICIIYFWYCCVYFIWNQHDRIAFYGDTNMSLLCITFIMLVSVPVWISCVVEKDYRGMHYLHCARKILVRTLAFVRALLLCALLFGSQLGLLTSFTFARGFSNSNTQNVRSIDSSNNNRWDCNNNANDHNKNCNNQQNNRSKQNNQGNQSNQQNNIIPLLPRTGCDPSPDASPDASRSCQ